MRSDKVFFCSSVYEKKFQEQSEAYRAFIEQKHHDLAQMDHEGSEVEREAQVEEEIDELSSAIDHEEVPE
jgi:hypothetical protein